MQPGEARENTLRVGVAARLAVCLSLAAAVICGSARADVDLDAGAAFLRTQAENGGTEVSSPTVGQLVYFHVEYRLIGSATALNGRARALIDGQPHCAGSLDFAPGAGQVVWCNNSWVARAGTHVLHWELDTDNAIDETNEGNNTAELVFTVGTPSADLVAGRAYLRTAVADGGDEVSIPEIGQEVFVHLAYHLDGLTVHIPGEVRALIDDQQQCRGSLDLAPSGTLVIWCNEGWTATPGQHTVRWELDPDNVIAESNEQNNVAELVFTVGPPLLDLIAVRAFLRTEANGGGTEVSSPEIGQQVFPYAAYRLVGTDALLTHDIRATFDGQQQCGGPIDSPPGDNLLVWCTNAWPATAGTHRLRWNLDPNNAVAETSETNNSASVVFGVGGPVGDANCDARVSAADLTGLVQHLAGSTRAACLLDDANANQQIEARDISSIIVGLFAPAA